MIKTETNYLELLNKVKGHEEFSGWKKVGDGGDGPLYRDFRSDKNPHLQLSRFGLYDHINGKVVESLVSIAKRLGLQVVSNFQQDTTCSEFRSENDCNQDVVTPVPAVHVQSPQIKKLQEKILARTSEENKSRWYERHWPLIKKYFQDVRKIELDPEFFRKELRATATTFKRKDSNESIYEILVPVWSSESRSELVQVWKCQVNPRTGEKVEGGKKVLGSAEGRGRGIWWPGDKAEPEGKEGTLIFEGLEDALSVYMAFLAKGGAEGSEWNFLVSCGLGYFSHIRKWIEESTGTNANDHKWVLILDNDGEIGEGKGQSEKASLLLGSRVKRFKPLKAKSDANLALVESGTDGVWRWLDEVRRNPVSVESIEEQVKELGEKKVQEVRGDPKGYYWKVDPLSESATEGLFVRKCNRRVKVSHGGIWRKWEQDGDGGMWVKEGGAAEARGLVSSLHIDYENEAAERGVVDEEELGAWRRWARGLGSVGRQEKVLRGLVGVQGISCKEDDFDSDLDLFNVANGVLRLSTGELLRARPEFMCSKKSPVTFDSSGSAKCPTFDRFLEEICCGDKELIGYKLRQYGYLLSGETSEKVFFFHWGEKGNNGKTVEASLLLKIFGDYGKITNNSLFTTFGNRGGFDGNQLYELARLAGVRLAVCSETDESSSWSEAALKRYTGGEDPVVARPIREEPFSFYPNFRLIVHGNNKPKINVGDAALWRRFHLIPYNFYADKPDIHLGKRLWEERSGILNRIWEGYQEWKVEGLKPPACVRESLEEYQKEATDDLEEFVETCCVMEEKAEESFRKLYQAYEIFCRNLSRKPRTQTALGRFLTQKGAVIVRSKTARNRSGIRLISDIEKQMKDFGNADEDDDGLM